MSSGQLTDEQQRRIEENRRKALEKRAARLRQQQEQTAWSTNTASTTFKLNINRGNFVSSNAAQPPRDENALLSSNKPNSYVPQRQMSAKSEGVKHSLNVTPSVGQASNANLSMNGNTIRSSTGFSGESQNSLVGASKAMVKPSNNERSSRSFQSTVSQFYRPQNIPDSSSSKRKFESTNPGTKPSTVSSSGFANSNSGSLKSGVVSSVNVKNTEKEVKGNCVLMSRERFAVVVPYQPQVIGIFKTIPSRSYGKIHLIGLLYIPM